MLPVAYIKDGKLVSESTPTHTNETKRGSSELGKDAFLQLLVTQMQNQDPLNPSSDTEFIAQLAQFSALEQMQNLNVSMQNQNAYGLVGKNVIISVGLSKGEVTNTVAGYVQYVEMRDGKAYLAINEELYSIEDLDTVLDDKYLDDILNEKPGDGSETDKPGNGTETEKPEDGDEKDPDKDSEEKL